MQKKNKKKSFVSEVIPLASVPVNLPYYEENTCHRQSLCSETILRFHISLRETFSKSFLLIMMKKFEKGAVMQISQLFGTL